MSLFVGVLILNLITFVFDAFGLNESTHVLVNQQAVELSDLDAKLRTNFGFSIDTRFNGNTVIRWIELGGFYEDRPYCRSARHFHDPLKPWPVAGLVTNATLIRTFCGSSTFASSLVWAQTQRQDPESQLNGNWSWHDARRHFLGALTAPEPKQRERAWADAFRALGQVMHLFGDASVPEHVRNDIHPSESLWRAVGLRGHGSYEYWVSDQHKNRGGETRFIREYLQKPGTFEASLLARPTEDPATPIVIASLVDSGIYRGKSTGPDVTKTGLIGIAEFANANFFSEDTTDGSVYPFPDPARLVPTEHEIAEGSRVRAYYRKGDGDGVQVDPVLAECAIEQAAFDSGVPSDRTVKCTDAKVWATVASHMLPRAVGYARGVLDYFFRGRLAVQVTISKIDTGLQANVRITNETRDEAMQGTFAVYYDLADGARVPLVTPSATALAPLQSMDVVVSPLPRDMPLSPWTVVFKGQLGQEPDAVAAAVALSEIAGVLTYYRRETIPDIGWTLELAPAFQDISPYFRTIFGTPYMTAGQRVHRVAQSGPWFETTTVAVWTIVYRNLVSPDALPVAVNVYSQWTKCGGFDSLGYLNYFWRHLGQYREITGPEATAEIVELAPPGDLATLFGYTYLQPPQVLRPLVAVSQTAASTTSSELSGAKFLGFRVTSRPLDPGPLPEPAFPEGLPVHTVEVFCGATVTLDLP